MISSPKILSTLVSLLFIALAIGSSSDSATEEEISSQDPAYQVTAAQLYADYETNGVAADQKYKGKVILVVGEVENIDRDIMDDIYVTLATGELIGSVQCMFSESHANEASALRKGQRIAIKGKCDGQMMNVILRGCSIGN